MPDETARERIFRIHTRKMALDENAQEFKRYVQATEGATGADIKAIVTEAGMFAIRREVDTVTNEDFFAAINKVIKCGKTSIDHFNLYT